MLYFIKRFVGLLIIAGLLFGCAKKPNEAAIIDASADGALLVLNATYPGADALYEKAAGTLVMPLISEFGFGLGGAYGRGVLRISGTASEYYNMMQGSYGIQAGGQRYSHVIFFITQESLDAFRANGGIMIGADAEYVIPKNAYGLRADDVTSRSPVISVVFNESGLKAGVSLNGSKFSRFIP